MHNLKTGALLTVSATMGARCAGATAEQLACAKEFGACVGLAFQLADDILDADEDAGDDGPPSFVKLIGIEATRKRALELSSRAEALADQLPNPATLIRLAQFIVHRDH